MGMVAMLWFWNFSGVFLPSLRLDLSGLGVGVPSQGPELSLDWLDPFSFLCFSAFGLTSSFWLLGFPAPIFFFPVCLAIPFILSLLVCSSLQPSRFFSRVLFYFRVEV